MKLSTKVLLLVLGVTLGTSALVIWVVTLNATRFESHRAAAAINAAIQRYLVRIGERHRQIDRSVRGVIESPEIRSLFQRADAGDADGLSTLRQSVFGDQVLLQLVNEHRVRPSFHALVNLAGETLFAAAPEKPALEGHLLSADVDWPYERVIDQEQLVRWHLLAPDGLYIVLGVPLRAQLDQPPTHAYFVGVRVEDEWVHRQLFSEDATSPDVPLVAWFVTGGRVVASASSGTDRPADLPADVAGRAPAAPMDAAGPMNARAFEFSLAGERYLGEAFDLAGLGESPGRVVLASSLDRALAPLRRLRRQILLITLAACCAAVAAAQWVSRLISRPIERMVAGTQRIAAGRFGEPVDVRRNDELGVLAGALNDMALGLKERERLREEKVKRDHDLDVARKIQMGVLPAQLPDVAGYQIASYADPAEQTGGDIFDVVELPDDPTPAGPAVAFLLADATGHGIGPAISVTQVRAMLRMGVRLRQPLARVLDEMNRQLCADLGVGRFVTAVIGRLDPHAHRLDYFSPGQAPLLHYHAADQRCQWLDATATPLGVMEDPPDDGMQTMRLAPGDVVALLTDGFYEYARADGAMFDKAQVAAVLRANHCRPAQEILGALLVAVAQFAGDAPQLDDMTAIILKRAA